MRATGTSISLRRTAIWSEANSKMFPKDTTATNSSKSFKFGEKTEERNRMDLVGFRPQDLRMTAGGLTEFSAGRSFLFQKY